MFVNEYIIKYALLLLLRISESVKLDVFGYIYSFIICKNSFFRLLSIVFQFIYLTYPTDFLFDKSISEVTNAPHKYTKVLHTNKKADRPLSIGEKDTSLLLITKE
jgi:hypothetical protein